MGRSSPEQKKKSGRRPHLVVRCVGRTNRAIDPPAEHVRLVASMTIDGEYHRYLLDFMSRNEPEDTMRNSIGQMMYELRFGESCYNFNRKLIRSTFMRSHDLPTSEDEWADLGEFVEELATAADVTLEKHYSPTMQVLTCYNSSAATAVCGGPPCVGVLLRRAFADARLLNEIWQPMRRIIVSELPIAYLIVDWIHRKASASGPPAEGETPRTHLAREVAKMHHQMATVVRYFGRKPFSEGMCVRARARAVARFLEDTLYDMVCLLAVPHDEWKASNGCGLRMTNWAHRSSHSMAYCDAKEHIFGAVRQTMLSVAPEEAARILEELRHGLDETAVEDQPKFPIIAYHAGAAYLGRGADRPYEEARSLHGRRTKWYRKDILDFLSYEENPFLDTISQDIDRECVQRFTTTMAMAIAEAQSPSIVSDFMGAV